MNQVEKAIEDIRQGRMVIVVDDEHRENEGDLVMAAEKVTPEAINFMVREGRGLVCVPMMSEDLDRLGLPLMVNQQEDHFRTAFTVSVDARKGVTTGISAQDRAKTIQVMAHPVSQPRDLAKPGHVFPLQYRLGRGAAPRRAYGSRGGSGPPGGLAAHGGHLRDHEGRRKHGPHG